MNLGAPDKVILVDIYQASQHFLHMSNHANANRDRQTICGMSVVPGDWDSLKRYNLTELYKQASTVAKKADSDVKKSKSKSDPSTKTEVTH